MTERSRSVSRKLRLALLVAIGLLYLLSVPWYWSADAPFEIWFGLPSWVAVALGCYAIVAILNAIAWLLTDLPDALPPSDTEGRGQ